MLAPIVGQPKAKQLECLYIGMVGCSVWAKERNSMVPGHC